MDQINLMNGIRSVKAHAYTHRLAGSREAEICSRCVVSLGCRCRNYAVM